MFVKHLHLAAALVCVPSLTVITAFPPCHWMAHRSAGPEWLGILASLLLLMVIPAGIVAGSVGLVFSFQRQFAWPVRALMILINAAALGIGVFGLFEIAAALCGLRIQLY